MSLRRSCAAAALAVCLAPTFARAIEPDPITAERPLFVFRAPPPDTADALLYADRLRAAWDALDESLRPVAALELPGPRTGEVGWGDRFADVVNELQVAGIPIIVSITDSPRTLFPLDELRRIFDRFTLVRGVHVAGLRFDDYPALASSEPAAVPAQVRWLAQTIDAASEYGRRVLIELDGLEWVHVAANTWNEPLLDSMRRHPAVAVPLNGQRGSHSVAATSTLLGLWIEGAAAQWGLSCDSTWFAASRFVQPGVFGDDPAASMPPAFYRAMILNGAMTGAAVYRFPAHGDLWAGGNHARWDEAIAPTLREIHRRGYIARKEFVLGKMKTALRLAPASSLAEFGANLADLDPIFHPGKLLHGAYGLELPGQVPELILNTGVFYWVPVLSPFAGQELLQHFKDVVPAGAMQDASEWRDRLSAHYTPDGAGTAFISRVGRATFILHTRENFYEEQPFTLAAVPAPVRGATANRQPDGIEIGWTFREGDVFYRVYRRVLPATEWEQISGDLDALSFRDAAVPTTGETVAYAVAALTNETEPFEGTVNYGDYLVINTVESRIVEEIVFEPDTQAATSLPVPPSVDGRPDSQQWWPDYGDLEGDSLLAAQQIVAQLESFELAYRTGDAATLLGLYDPNYADPQGWGADYARAAWDLFFRRYRPGPVHRQLRAWDLTQFSSGQRVVVRLYYRIEAQAVETPAAESPSEPVVFPPAPNGEVSFTFRRTGDRWLIVATDPAVPRIDDWLPAAAPR